MLTVKWSSPKCRRNKILKNMLNSKNLEYKMERARHPNRKYRYPVVITPSGKIIDYNAITVILGNDRLEELE